MKETQNGDLYKHELTQLWQTTGTELPEKKLDEVSIKACKMALRHPNLGVVTLILKTESYGAPYGVKMYCQGSKYGNHIDYNVLGKQFIFTFISLKMTMDNPKLNVG